MLNVCLKMFVLLENPFLTETDTSEKCPQMVCFQLVAVGAMGTHCCSGGLGLMLSTRCHTVLQLQGLFCSRPKSRGFWDADPGCVSVL